MKELEKRLKCIALTKKGKACPNEVVEGTNYCHMAPHKAQGIISSKNQGWLSFIVEPRWTWIIYVVAASVAILTFLGITFNKRDTRESLITTPLSQNVTSINQSGGITAGTVTQNITYNTYIVSQLQNLEENLYTSLNNKYPLGYKLFALHKDGKIILHNEESIIKGCLVDWDSAKVGMVTDSLVGFMWPSIKIEKSDNKHFHVSNGSLLNNFSNIPRIKGVTRLFEESFMLPFDEYAEVIKNEPETIYMVIGFKEKKE